MVHEITRFVNWMRRRNPHARTWRDYSYDLKQFVAAVGDQPPNEVTIQDIDQFIITQAADKLKPSTINRHLAAIISFYSFLADEDPDLICPVLPHRHTLRTGIKLPRSLPNADVQHFFAAIETNRDRAMFLLMLRCGLRISEVAQLKQQDVSLNEDPPRLLISGKNSKERIAYLSPQVVTVLQTYLTERQTVTCDALFLSYQGQGLSTTAIHKRLMRYRQKADVHLTAHQLRHTFANDLVTLDVPVTTIQKLLGHSWLSTTQTYIAANDHKVQADFYTATEVMEGWS